MLKEKLIELLKTNKNFVNNNNELLIDKILTSNNKNELIKLLLKDDEIKKYFFEEIDNVLIFKENDFITFIKSREYLKDSWTKYDNEIKFNLNKLFNENIVLDFPYKDCVLEGGQTKDDEKKNERFYNEILCKDEISRMFEPKIFTNYEKIEKINNNVTTNNNNNDLLSLSLSLQHLALLKIKME